MSEKMFTEPVKQNEKKEKIMEKTVFVYREGNPFIESLIEKQENADVIKLKYGEEESWEKQIKEAISPDAVVFCDITTESFAKEALKENVKEIIIHRKPYTKKQEIRAIYGGLELSNYNNRQVYYDLILSEAKKYNSPVLILDNITDHISIYKEVEKRAAASAFSEEAANQEIKKELVDEIILAMKKNGLKTDQLANIKDKNSTLLIDHHAVRLLSKDSEVTCKLICPCCVEQVLAKNLFREYPRIKFEE